MLGEVVLVMMAGGALGLLLGKFGWVLVWCANRILDAGEWIARRLGWRR